MLQFEVDDSYLARVSFDPAEEVRSWLENDSMHKIMLSIGRSLDSACYRLKGVRDRADSMPGEPGTVRGLADRALECSRPRLPYYDWEFEEGLLSAEPLRILLQYMAALPQDWPVPSVRWYDSANTPCRSSNVGELCDMLRYTGSRLEKNIALSRAAHAVYMETRKSPIPRETGYNPALPVRVQSMEPAAWRSLVMRGKAPELVQFFRTNRRPLQKDAHYILGKKEGAGYVCLRRDNRL